MHPRRRAPRAPASGEAEGWGNAPGNTRAWGLEMAPHPRAVPATASPSLATAPGCAQAGLSPARTRAVGHRWHLCWRTSVRWMLPQLRFQLPWPLPWGRRDLPLLGSKIQDTRGTPNASQGANPSCSGVVCSWPSNTDADMAKPFRPALHRDACSSGGRAQPVPTALGHGDHPGGSRRGWLDVEDVLTGVPRCRRKDGVPAESEPSPRGRDGLSSQAMLVLCCTALLPSFGAACWWHFPIPVKNPHPSPSPRRPASSPCAIFLPLLQFLPLRVPMVHR